MKPTILALANNLAADQARRRQVLGWDHPTP
jgi:hypothetical protein